MDRKKREGRRLPGWLPLVIFAAQLWCLGYVELDRAAALSDLTTQVEIAASRSEINELRAKAFRKELTRREERCFHWGGKP